MGSDNVLYQDVTSLSYQGVHNSPVISGDQLLPLSVSRHHSCLRPERESHVSSII